jgi:hypothetical protein
MLWRIWDPLLKALMGAGLVEIENILASGGDGVASHARPRSDPDILVSHSPENVHRPHSRGRVRYGVRSTLIPVVVATRAKLGPNFLSLSRMRYLGVWPYGVASRSGTRHPRISGRTGHIHMKHLPRL